LSRPNIKPVVTALLVSPFASDHHAVLEVFSYLGWVLNVNYNCAEAVAFMRQTSNPVVICERDLREGNWKTVPQAFGYADLIRHVSNFEQTGARVNA
jgi:hypothetical protein